MRLIDAARELPKTDVVDNFDQECPFCGMNPSLHGVEGWEYQADIFGKLHHLGCPWLSLPKIVAALEAAERLNAAWQMPRASSPIPGSYSGVLVDWKRGQARADAITEAEAALVAALSGEGAPS